MLKRILTITLIALSTFICAISCASETRNTAEKQSNKDIMKTEGKKLVVFFSHTGENYNVGYIEKGNTHIVADMIAEATGAEKFEIVPVKAYPKNYNECIDVAKKEKQANARSAIKEDIKTQYQR